MPYVRNTWVDYPATTTAITAARLNNIELGILAVETSVNTSVFATEAARDAAIPVPFEGQRAYITGSTVATAAGTNTAIPTGIQTIYNGAAWVCVTPVSANTDATGTTTLNAFSTTLAGTPGTAPSVTLATGTTALISFGAIAKTNTAASGAFVTVGISSGSDTGRAGTEQTQLTSIGRTTVMTGLVAGNNTFVLFYKVDGTATGTFNYRSLTVQGIA